MALRVALIGHGAIGASVRAMLADDPRIAIAALVVTSRSLAALSAAVGDRPRVVADVAALLDGTDPRPDLVVECAGHAAIRAHVLPALRAGIDALVVSTGALADDDLHAALEDAARAGGARVRLLSGAIGAIDALSAAREGGLAAVRYRGRKPPLAWRGTPAERHCDLARVATATTIFSGSAREAAVRYPKNANVAATVALAGVGLDRTVVELIADPSVDQNVHQVEAEGAFGSFTLELHGHPLAANPKTSALTAYSVVRAIRARVATIAI